MEKLNDDHRGHAIVTHASGPYVSKGPYIAFYSVWRIDSNNSYRAVIQGHLPTKFETSESAELAAITEAKTQLDAVLDAA